MAPQRHFLLTAFVYKYNDTLLFFLFNKGYTNTRPMNKALYSAFVMTQSLIHYFMKKDYFFNVIS